MHSLIAQRASEANSILAHNACFFLHLLRHHRLLTAYFVRVTPTTARTILGIIADVDGVI